jgi:hypothetical protein
MTSHAPFDRRALHFRLSLNDARSAEVTNSATASSAAAAAPPDECVEIQEKYRAIMNSINADRFDQLMKLNKDAQAGVGLKVDIKQKAKPKCPSENKLSPVNHL